MSEAVTPLKLCRIVLSRIDRRRLTRVVCLALLAVPAAAAWLRLGPISPDLLDERTAISTIVVDRHGTVLYEALSSAGTRRATLASDNLPPVLVAATTAAEDRRFWLHPGVDPLALLRAAARDVVRRRLVEGGSTITQQVAKLLVARRDAAAGVRTGMTRRGFGDKVREAVLALRLEHRFTKREILALYLNLASYGNQLVGAERASQAYFGCPASMLTPAQAAFLAALPQQPSRFNPYRDTRLARARQGAVLQRMLAAGSITAEQSREALGERLALRRPQAPFSAPHFVEMVLASRPAGPSAGRIETTLDAALQSDVAGIIESHRDVLRAHGAANVAVVVLGNATGEWLAWEGSGDYFDAAHGGAINGPLAPRQPGSALKPLTYALAFEQGYSPASVLPDVPMHFPTAEPGVLYSPRNYDGRYRGPLLARHALAGSENVPAVALASEIGVPGLLRFFQRAGLTTFDRTAAHYGVGVTLGNAEVRLAELVAAYSAFARGGTWLLPVAVKRAAGDGGEGERPLVSPRTAFWITDILSDADAREYIFGRGGALEFPFPVAAKTGTSQAYHDNWTIGYTQAVTVGVWVGNFDRTPLRDSTGVTGAAPIFHAVMLAAERRVEGAGAPLADRLLATPPEGMERVEICALSGMRANPWCPTRIHEWLPAGGEALPCSWHHASDEGLLTVWPPEFRQWAAQHGLLQDLRPRRGARSTAADARRASVAALRSNRMDIVNPPDGATYSIDPTLRRDFQALALRAVTPEAGNVEWRVDGVRIGTGPSDAPQMWPLAPGRHVITALDERGHVARAAIAVK
jgi:penicillin-binding protein 1C